MDIRCPVSSSKGRGENRKKPKREKKKGSKVLYTVGEMGFPKKGISEKGQTK
jgi:hypothetical protein